MITIIARKIMIITITIIIISDNDNNSNNSNNNYNNKRVNNSSLENLCFKRYSVSKV